MMDYGPNIQALEELEATISTSACGPTRTWLAEDGVTEVRGYEVQIGCQPQSEISAIKAIMPVGAVFREHKHDSEIEVLICYQGRLRIETDDGAREIGPGGIVRFYRGERHKVMTLGDAEARLLGVTVPASAGYSTEEQPDAD